MLKELLADHQLFHSKFQQDRFITNRAGGTMYGQYQQALRELYKRVTGLRETICDHKKLEVEVRREQHKSDHSEDEFEIELAIIEHARKTMQLEESSRVIRGTQDEFKRFYCQAMLLRDKLIEEHGELTPEVKERLDVEMWEFKAKEMIALDFLATNTLGRNTLEFIGALPDDMRLPLVQIISADAKPIIEWYQKNMDRYQLDSAELSQIECEDIGKYIGISIPVNLPALT